MTTALLLLSSIIAAQPHARGFVVRADSSTVWLDLTAADGAAPGRSFEVYDEGEELRHPVSGESLGRVRKTVAEGRIVELAEKHSLGKVAALKGELKPGQRARLADAAPPPLAAAPLLSPDARAAEPGARAPKLRGATLDYAVVGLAVADFDASKRPQLALASEDAIRLYAYPGAQAAPLAEAELEGTGARALGLDAADLDGDGKAELFVSVYDDAFRRFETRVYELEGGKWAKVAELPFLTRSYQDAAGARVLGSQQIVDDKTFPFGSIYPLAYRDGKYVQASPALKMKRAEWLFGLNVAQLGAGEPSLLYLTNVHALRVQRGSHSWRTADDDYGQTPVRVRWHDRLLEFNPPMPALYGASGFEGLFTARNFAALGGLASPFGLFNRAELQRKRWNGLALETAWKAEIPGCVQGIAVAEPEPGRAELVTAIRGSAQQSSIWVFEL